jgi:hypothetical protein
MKHLTTVKHLPTIINFTAGLLLLMLGLVGYASPEWFFTHKYDVLMPSPQSRTILKVMMGTLWLAACVCSLINVDYCS